MTSPRSIHPSHRLTAGEETLFGGGPAIRAECELCGAEVFALVGGDYVEEELEYPCDGLPAPAIRDTKEDD